MMRKVAGKKVLVDRDVLDGDDVLARLAAQHPVHQQKWIAMRQVLENLMYVHAVHCGFPLSLPSFTSSCRTRSASSSRLRNWAAFFSHRWCDENGYTPV